MKTLVSNDEFITTFQILGSSCELPEDFITRIERFVCSIYGNTTNNVNETRYKMYCASNGSIDRENLPPCSNALNLQMLRANYVSKIWKMSLKVKPVIPSPDGHGWMYEEDHLCIKWLTVGAAPEEIFEFMSCSFSRTCTCGKCCCIDNGMKCTDLCVW